MCSCKWLVPLILVLVVSCNEQPIALTPTVLVDEGVEETVTPDGTRAVAPTTSPPTETATATATPPPPTATVEPTPAVSVSLTTPEAEATLDVGSEVTVAGEVGPAADVLTVSLVAAGVSLVEDIVPLQETATTWETVLTVPETFTGRALLRITAAETTIERSVVLRRPATAGTSIELTHPSGDSAAVSGQVLFFTGQVQQPIDNELTIGVLYEECQVVGARQTFEVGEGGQWWGFVLIPDTVRGPACAIAYTGGFGTEGWRASVNHLTILQADDPAARDIFVGNFAFEEVVPGEVTTVYGSAYNTNQVDVHMEVGSRTVAAGTADVNPFGYWEVDLTLPADVPRGDEGFYVARTTYGDEVVEERSPFLVAAE